MQFNFLIKLIRKHKLRIRNVEKRNDITKYVY